MVLKVVGLSVAGALVGGMIGRLSRRGTLDGMFDGLGSVGSRVFIAGLIVGAIYGLLILVVVQMRRRLLQARHAALQRQAEADRTARQLADARLKLSRRRWSHTFCSTRWARCRISPRARRRRQQR